MTPPHFLQHHELIVLFGLAVFPRITLLVASFATGGLLWWLGWLICPRLLIAILSLAYWQSNPALVIIAWILVFTAGKGDTEYQTSKAVCRACAN